MSGTMQNSCRVALALAFILLLCSVNVVLSGKAQSKKCQQYGHSCLGGHGKRSSSSSDMAKPSYSTQLASDEPQTPPDYDDVSPIPRPDAIAIPLQALLNKDMPGLQNIPNIPGIQNMPNIAGMSTGNYNKEKDIKDNTVPSAVYEPNAYPRYSTPLWILQRGYQKRHKSLNSDPYPVFGGGANQAPYQSQISQQQLQPQSQGARYNHRFADIDQIYPVRVKGSVGQFSITDQIPFPL